MPKSLVNTKTSFNEFVCFSIIDSPSETAKEISTIFNCLIDTIKVFLLKTITIIGIDNDKAFSSFRHNFYLNTNNNINIRAIVG